MADSAAGMVSEGFADGKSCKRTKQWLRWMAVFHPECHETTKLRASGSSKMHRGLDVVSSRRTEQRGRAIRVGNPGGPDLIGRQSGHRPVG